LIAGMLDFLRIPDFYSLVVVHLGYPEYFLTLMGSTKVLAGVAILLPGFPRLKEWATPARSSLTPVRSPRTSRWAAVCTTRNHLTRSSPACSASCPGRYNRDRAARSRRAELGCS
jgi:DoxX-like protein